MLAEHRQRRAFIAANRQHLQTVHCREAEKCAIAQRLIQLDPQTAQIVMIAAETDLGDMLRRHALQIAQLIVKAAEYMRLQQFRPCLAGEPAAIVKDVHAGLGIPFAVQHRFRRFGSEILAIKLLPFQRMDARPVAGDQKCIKGKFANHMVHLQHMAAGGEGQGDIALTQPFQRGKRLFSKTMVRHQQGAVHIKCRQFCHGIFPDV